MVAPVQPPGPWNPPILGNLSRFRREPLTFLKSIAHRYGDIVYFRLGPKDVYFLNHPDLIKDVLVTRNNNFIKSRVLQKARRFLGTGLLTSEGEFHLRQRRLVQPAFHRDRLIGYAAVMAEYAVRAADRLQDGALIEMDLEMMRLTLAIVAKTLFSAEVESDANEIGKSLATILNMFDAVLAPFSEILEKLPLPANRRAREAREKLDAIIYRIIKDRRREAVDRGDLLSMLLLAQDHEGDGTGMSDEQVRDEALTLFLAGHETTANALTWTWYLLAMNPEAEAKMHAEIDRVLGGRTPGFDDLAALQYTERVFSESMRLYPPAWIIGREALHSFDLDRHRIERGSFVVMSPYVMHRDPRYYPEPERFDPDRWLPEISARRPKFAYFPFGGGPRVCVGERFAWMEGVLLLAALAQSWRFRLVPGHPVEPLPLITLRTRHGMKMTVEARQQHVSIGLEGKDV